MSKLEVTLFHMAWEGWMDALVEYPDGSDEVLTFVEDPAEADEDENDIHLWPFDLEGCENWAREVAASMGYAGCQILIKGAY